MPPPAARSTPGPPLPYKVGKSLELNIPSGEVIQVSILRIHPVTVSPVMEVLIRTVDGAEKAVLKLFDRCFGEQRERHPYNKEAEEAWQNSIRSDTAEARLKDLQDFDDSIKRKRFRDANDGSDDDDDDEEGEEENEEDELKENEINIFTIFESSTRGRFERMLN